MITRLFVGIGEAGYGPAAPTIISDLYPIERRGYVLSYFYMAIPVGSALGYLWGGKVQAWINWRWAFYTVVPPGLALGAVCFLFRDPRDRDSSKSTVEKPRRASLRDYLSLLRNRSYVLDCAGMTAMTFAIGGISFWMPDYLTEYRKAGTLDHVNFIFGLLTAIAGLTATMAGGITGDKLRARFPGSYFLVSGAGILIACPFVILMLYVDPPWIWIALFIAMFFLFFNTGPSNTILANVTSPSIRATAFALNILIIHLLGDVVSPPLLGRVVGEGEHWNRAFILITIIMAFAAGLWLWGAVYLDEDTRRASPSPS
jgi:MFS family permease